MIKTFIKHILLEHAINTAFDRCTKNFIVTKKVCFKLSELTPDMHGLEINPNESTNLIICHPPTKSPFLYKYVLHRIVFIYDDDTKDHKWHVNTIRCDKRDKSEKGVYVQPISKDTIIVLK